MKSGLLPISQAPLLEESRTPSVKRAGKVDRLKKRKRPMKVSNIGELVLHRSNPVV